MGGGKRCSIGWCKSQSDTHKHLSFYAFPKDPQVVIEWMKKCNRLDRINPKYARICSLHFKPTDYERNLKAELLNLKCRKKLKPNVVPSVLLEPPESDPTVVSKRPKRGRKILKIPIERLDTSETKTDENTTDDPLEYRQESPITIEEIKLEVVCESEMDD